MPSTYLADTVFLRRMEAIAAQNAMRRQERQLQEERNFQMQQSAANQQNETIQNLLKRKDATDKEKDETARALGVVYGATGQEQAAPSQFDEPATAEQNQLGFLQGQVEAKKLQTAADLKRELQDERLDASYGRQSRMLDMQQAKLDWEKEKFGTEDARKTYEFAMNQNRMISEGALNRQARVELARQRKNEEEKRQRENRHIIADFYKQRKDMINVRVTEAAKSLNPVQQAKLFREAEAEIKTLSQTLEVNMPELLYMEPSHVAQELNDIFTPSGKELVGPTLDDMSTGDADLDAANR